MKVTSLSKIRRFDFRYNIYLLQ